MSDFRTYITQMGFGLEREAKLNNTHVPFANLVVGDGKLNDASTPADQTGLVNKIKSYPVTIEKDDADPSVWVARAEIPASEGGFSIFEAGLETSDGHLYCYARQPGDYKPLLSEGLGKSYTIRLKFIPSNADTIEIKIDPSVQFVTPTDLSNVENGLRSSLDSVISAGGLNPDPEDEEQLAQSVSKQIRSRNLFDVSGTADAVILTTKSNKQPVKSLSDLDEFLFVVPATNTGAVTLKIDGLGPIAISNIVSTNQLFKSALARVMYRDNAYYLIDQINPKTGSSVLDIAKLFTDTVDILRPGEYALDGAALSRTAHPIAFAIVSASSNYIDQATKDADPISYGGFYGDGDGSTTFTLPIVGGEFIRMFDGARGIDIDREFGSWQDHQFEDHKHRKDDASIIQDLGFSHVGGTNFYTASIGSVGLDNSGDTGSVSSSNFGEETRPRSIAYFGKTRL